MLLRKVVQFEVSEIERAGCLLCRTEEDVILLQVAN